MKCYGIRPLRMIAACALLAGAAFLTGCESTAAHRIDPAGRETITTVTGINIQDWNDAAANLSQSLLNSGALERSSSQPATLVISRFVNNTSLQVDRDQLIKKVRIVLNESGKAYTYTTLGAGGAEDPIARDQQAKDQFLNGTQAPRPDYSLTLKIMEDQVRAKDIRQATYTFQMSLTDLRNGLAVWEGETQIAKQGSRPTVGW